MTRWHLRGGRVLGTLLTAVLIVGSWGARPAQAGPRTDPPPASARPGGGGGGGGHQVLSPTPYQGWNTYYGLGGDFTAAEVLDVADALVDRGLARAGYDIVWLDGGWQDSVPRGADGLLRPDPARFPQGLAALTAAIHAKGLRAGIYTDAGPYVEGRCGLGSGGHYQTDADTFAAWGFDAVKVDYLCGIAADLDPKTVYTEFAQAIRDNASHRPMIINLCNPVTSPDCGDYPESQQSTNSWSYAPGIVTSWRTYTDVGFAGSIKYSDVVRNFDANARHPEVAGPGRWSDPDYLGPELGMTDAQFRGQLSLWAISAAPLVIGSDVRTLSNASVAALTDPDVLAIDQDRLGRQGRRVGPAGTTETWVKPLADGSRAVLLLNRGSTAAMVGTDARSLGLPRGRVRVLDTWSDERTESRGTVRAAVPAQGTVLLRVTPSRHAAAAPRLVTGAPTVVGAAADGLVQPGATVTVRVLVVNDGSTPAVRPTVGLRVPDGWPVRSVGREPAALRPGRAFTASLRVTVGATARAGDDGIGTTLRFLGVRGRSTLRTDGIVLTVAPAPPQGQSALSRHPWISATSGWMTPAVDQSVGGGPIRIAGTTYAAGIGVASPSDVRYFLGGSCTRLTGVVGIDDAVENVGPEGGTSTFSVVGDGRVLYASPTVVRDQTVAFDVDLSGVRDLHLLVGDAGDGGYNDRADWAGLAVSCA